MNEYVSNASSSLHCAMPLHLNGTKIMTRHKLPVGLVEKVYTEFVLYSPAPLYPPWTSLHSSQVRPTLGETKIVQMWSATGNEISDTFANQVLLVWIVGYYVDHGEFIAKNYWVERIFESGYLKSLKYSEWYWIFLNKTTSELLHIMLVSWIPLGASFFSSLILR